jgi:hypothetical protein
MTATLIRRLTAVVAGAILTIALVGLDSSETIAQPVKADDEATGSPRVANCRRCHRAPLPEDEKNGVTKFITLTESETWRHHDLHALAYANIVPRETDGTPNLAARMQKVLEPHRPKGYVVNQAAECLVCHATDLSDPRKPEVPLSAKTAAHFDTESGVSCEACHGLSNDWVGPHFNREWRDVLPANKSAKGLVDLRDPYTRALKCASCHVGNLAEGKFVTHEVYAAGHPPLPPFELATFTHDAPRHSYAARENKALAELPAETAWKNFHFRKGECAEARSVAVGSVATFESSTRLLADVAKETKPGELIDFAMFDCWACHHDLKDPSWRQKRGYRGPPGRPVLRSNDTLPLVLKHAEGANGVNTERITKAASELLAEWAALNKNFDTTPFGRPDEAAKQAATLASQCGALRTELDPLVYDPAQTDALYQRVRERLTKGDAIDIESAQQMIWTVRALREELRATSRPEIPDDDRAPAALVWMTPFHVRGDKREPVAGERLKARLDRINRFDPEAFWLATRTWLKEK